MGLFSTLVVQAKLPLNKEIRTAFPDRNWKEVVFQTKDLDCALDHYKISRSGVLYKEKIEGEWITPERLKGDSWLASLPYIEEKSYKWVKAKNDRTATIEFYDYDLDREGNRWDIVFFVTFIDGKINTPITLSKAEVVQTAKEIKDQEKDRENKRVIESSKLHNRVRVFMNNITCSHWKSFWKFTSMQLSKASKFLSFVQIFILRYIA